MYMHATCKSLTPIPLIFTSSSPQAILPLKSAGPPVYMYMHMCMYVCMNE